MTKKTKTLEVVLVLVIIGALVWVMIGGMRIGDKMMMARNAVRRKDVEQIMMAMQQYLVDNEKFPEGVGREERQIGSCVIGGEQLCGGWYKCLDLESALLGYMEKVPVDSEFGSRERSGYSVALNEYGILTVRACGAEGGQTIDVSR